MTDNTPTDNADTRATPLPPAPKTTGERGYDLVQFATGKVFILGITAAIAYIARYGKSHYGPVPNYFKTFQDWCHGKLLHNSLLPLAEKGEVGKRIAGATANTMLLFHGGNLFAPFMKGIENHRYEIAHYINERWGKPGETEIADERLKNEPKQHWSDVIKGRLTAWTVVFTSLVSIDALIGKNKKTGLYRFDQYEEWFGRMVAGVTKGGKELGKIPLTQSLSAAQESNKMYRFGKILALDFYATSACILIWNAISRRSARKRAEAHIIIPPPPPEYSIEPKEKRSHAMPQPRLSEGYASMVSNAPEAQSLAI